MIDCKNNCGKIISKDCLNCSVHEHNKQTIKDNDRFETIMYRLKNNDVVNLGL